MYLPDYDLVSEENLKPAAENQKQLPNHPYLNLKRIKQGSTVHQGTVGTVGYSNKK